MKKKEEKKRKEGYLGRLVNLISDKNRKKRNRVFPIFEFLWRGTINNNKNTIKTDRCFHLSLFFFEEASVHD